MISLVIQVLDRVGSIYEEGKGHNNGTIKDREIKIKLIQAIEAIPIEDINIDLKIFIIVLNEFFLY